MLIVGEDLRTTELTAATLHLAGKSVSENMTRMRQEFYKLTLWHAHRDFMAVSEKFVAAGPLVLQSAL